MGPVGNVESPSSHMLSPPQMDSFEEQTLWREAVSDWAANVKVCADGGDRKAKGIVACLALTVYRSLEIGRRNK